MRKFLAAATAGVLAAVGLAGPAFADISLKSVAISASTIVLDGDAGCGDRIKVTVKVNEPTGDTDELFGVSGDVNGPSGDIADFLLLNYVSRSGGVATYSDSVFLCGFDAPGKHKITVTATWWDADLSRTREQEQVIYFYLKRPTTLTYNAAPEPAKKGASLTHSGRLMFDPFGYGKLYGPSGVTLKLSFKKSGTSSYVAKSTVKTTSGGYFSKKLVTTADGTWRVEYPNNTYRQTQTKADYVDTK